MHSDEANKKAQQLHLKKKRSENWLEEDKIILKSLIKDEVKVIENKNTDSNTNAKKVVAWAELRDNFNNLARTPRTLKQLKNQWCHIKITEKKAKFEERRQRLKTGGGPPPIVEQPINNDDIAAWLPCEFEIDSNEFDSDSQILNLPTAAIVIDQLEPGDVDGLDNDPLDKKDDLEQDPLIIHRENINKTPKPLCKKKRSTNIQMTASKAISDNEIACRKELHAIQMKNEQLKHENLMLKNELLKLSIENMKKKQ